MNDPLSHYPPGYFRERQKCYSEQIEKIRARDAAREESRKNSKLGFILLSIALIAIAACLAMYFSKISIDKQIKQTQETFTL